MKSFRLRLSGFAVAAAAVSSLALAACNTNDSTPAAPVTTQVRAVHGSPDAGPVDIYVYAQGAAIPTSPTLSNVSYPAVSPYLKVPAGAYTVAVFAHGAASSGTPVASENVSANANGQYSIVVAGQVATKTLQFVNFVEPAETAGQSALIVHHASPAVQAAVAPVGVGTYNPQTNPSPTAAQTQQLFAFSLMSPSGPAQSGQVIGGQFFVAPIPSAITSAPAAVGFAAGAPATANGQPLGSVALATPLTTLLPSGIPASGHVSVFAIDAPSPSLAQLIGTADP